MVSSDAEPYWKDCLDILFVPDGYEYHFRYQKKWIEQGVTAQQLEGKHALIVAQLREVKGGIPLHVPLRRCQIQQAVDRGAFIAITFTLGAFVSFGENPQSYVRDFDRSLRERLGTRIVDNGVGGPFVFFDSGLQVSYSLTNRLDNDWISIVSVLALSTRYQRTIFLGFRGLEDFKTREQVSYSEGAFHIRAGNTYKFRVAQYLPDSDSSGNVIERNKLTDFGSVSLDIVGGETRLLTSSQDIRGRYDELTFVFATNWSEKTAMCISKFTGTGKDSTYIPSIGLNLRVIPSRLYWGGLGLFFFGILAVAAVGILKEDETTAKVALTAIGTVLSAAGLYLAKRVL
jgi:hypothetical protein